MNEPTSVSEDPTEIARWGTDDARREYRRTRELHIADRMAQRRRMAAEFQAGGVEIPRDRGFVFSDGARFSDVPPVVAAARDVFAAAKPEKRKEKSNKQFMMKLLKQNLVTLDSPFMRLALHPDIVAPVARYLGVVPILQFVNVYFSCDSGDDLSKSQLYHCDSDDAEQVKVRVLVEDVTPETGPLTLLPAAESDFIRSTLGYTYELLLNDAQVSDVLGGRNVQHQFVRSLGHGWFHRHQPVLSFRQPVHRSDEEPPDCDVAVPHAAGVHYSGRVLGACAVPRVRQRAPAR